MRETPDGPRRSRNTSTRRRLRAWVWAGVATIAVGPASLPLVATERPRPVVSWSFDGASPAAAPDRLDGLVARVAGVSGEALRFDGFTTKLVRAAPEALAGPGGLAVEAWAAPQEYSWNVSAFANQGEDARSGFLLGIDHTGRATWSVAVAGEWQTVTSREPLPLLTWSHVAGSFDPARGLVLYVNGRPAGERSAPGPRTPSTAEVWVGATQRRMGVANTERDPSREALARTRHFFDGLLDEVRVYAQPLSPEDARAAFAAATPREPRPLRYRILPSGPADARRFGAFYTRLAYDAGWDAQWRSDGPDVVVAFDFAPVRLVSWRGTAYAPSWVTENGHWLNNEFMERWVDGAGCAESMSDKQARYSSTKVLESTDARAVLYWRYSPVDIHCRIPFADGAHGWGDWADEYYTVYPDGVAVRKFVGWTSVPRGRAFLEWSQSLPIFQPGERPDDVLDASAFVSLANMAGRSHTYAWPPAPDGPAVENANIQVVHYRSEYRPFLVLTDRNPKITLPPFKKREAGSAVEGMSMPEDTPFWWWNHWPVAPLPSDGRVAPAPDRPSHGWAATQDSDPWAKSDLTETQITLMGVTRLPAAGLVPLAKSWLRAPALEQVSAGWEAPGYDPAERAYTLRAAPGASERPLRFTIAATPDSPLRNVALVVEGWGEDEARLTLAGRPVPRGPAFRYGRRRGLERTDLVAWIEVEAEGPMTLSIERDDATPDKRDDATRP